MWTKSYDTDLMDLIITLCNYKFKAGQEDSHYQYFVNLVYLQKLGYFLNVLYMVKNNGQTLFHHNVFDTNSFGARIRQITVAYNRAFGDKYRWLTHCTSHFVNCATGSYGCYMISHVFDLYNFIKQYPKQFTFISKSLPKLLVFSPWRLVHINVHEQQYLYKLGVMPTDDQIYSYYLKKSNQFWLNPPKPGTTSHLQNMTSLDRIIINHSNEFNWLLSKFSKYNLNAWLHDRKSIQNMPNAISFYNDQGLYSYNDKSSHNEVIWLPNNTWNLLNLDVRIEPVIKRIIKQFENKIKFK